MSNNKQSSVVSEFKEYLSEKIISIAFSLMPKSEMRNKFGEFIIQTFGGNNEDTN